MKRNSSGLAMLTLSMLLAGAGCSSKPVSDAPSPEVKYGHAVTFTVTQLQNGSVLDGTIKARRDSDGAIFTGSFAQRIELGETKNSMENYSFTLSASGHLTREFNHVPISDNSITTNMIDNRVADIARFVADILLGGSNRSWVPRGIHYRFNARDGTRISTERINAMKAAANFVKRNSLGYIQSVTFDVNGSDQSGMPANEGEKNAYPDNSASFPSNTTYPSDGDRVTKGVILVAPVPTLAVMYEDWDNYWQGRQNFAASYSDGQLAQFFMISLNRPRGNDNGYLIDAVKEAQNGLDSFSTTSRSNPQVKLVQGSAPLTAFPGILAVPEVTRVWNGHEQI